MRVKIKVGQVWKRRGNSFATRITKIIHGSESGWSWSSTPIPGARREVRAYGVDIKNLSHTWFAVLDDDEYADLAPEWHLESEHKEIPGIPLDPNLPILIAGYIQDRQRKRYKHK